METIVFLTHVFDVMQSANDKGYCHISHPYSGISMFKYMHTIHAVREHITVDASVYGD